MNRLDALCRPFAIASLLAVSAATHAQHPTQPGGVFCMSDIDRDLLVDGSDLGLFLLSWGTTDASGDFNFDGSVNGADLGILLQQWGSTCHPFHANVEVSIEGDFVVVRGNGIPDHEMGNFPGECNNPNSVMAMNDEWRLPLFPEDI